VQEQCWHRLALELKATKAELKERMSWIEFLEWQQWFELHPFGTEWDDARMATLSANICAALTGKKQDVKDHMARYKKPARKQTPMQQLMILKDWTARGAACQTRR
jgi:hypothetical protein